MNQQKFKNTCGKRVKILRITKDMTQVDLAVALSDIVGTEINQRSISLIEKRMRFVKDFELLALAIILETHPMYLLFGDDVPDIYK